jgi:hypothetical protein
MVFDGITRQEKQYEDARRVERRKKAEDKISKECESAANPEDVDVSALVSNNSLYIAMCIKVCSFLSIPFTVAPFEADSQLPKHGCVVVSSDSDMLVLGVERWVSIDDWITGEGCLIDVTSFNVTHVKDYPFVAHVMQHGRIVFEISAVVFGCDFSENACGIHGIGRSLVSFFKHSTLTTTKRQCLIEQLTVPLGLGPRGSVYRGGMGIITITYKNW